MISTLLMLLVFAVICWAVWAARRIDHQERTARAGRYETGERRQQPEEIATGRLVLSETRCRTERPAPFVARVDQVFLTAAGLLVLVETKTRQQATAFLSDVIELSVQAAVLRHSPPPELRGRRVAPYAYVRCAPPGRLATYHRVSLMSDAQLLALRSRREALLAGKATPCRPQHQGQCVKCAFKADCYPRAA